MKKVNIALVDSGINKNIKGYRKNVTYISNEEWDTYGHGTACFNILKNSFINSNIDIIKILDSNGYTNIKVLYNALSDLVDSDIDIINLSISVIDDDTKYFSKVHNICNELFRKNKIIVCSLKNRETVFSIPAVFDCVLGVRGGCFKNNAIYWYNPNVSIQAVANATPVLTRSLNNKRYFFSGNSKATIMMTAQIAGAVYRCKDGQEVQQSLINGAEKIQWCESDIEAAYLSWINGNNYLEKLVDIQVLKFITDLVKRHKCVNAPTLNEFLSCGGRLNLKLVDVYIYLINLIEQAKHIRFKDETIQLIDFSNIYRLCYSIQHNWEKFE